MTNSMCDILHCTVDGDTFGSKKTRCFTGPYPCKVHELPSHQRTSKKGSFCAHFSFHNSLSHTHTNQSFLSFVFYSVSVWSYLPRTRTSDPRHSPDTPPDRLVYWFGWWCSRRLRFVRFVRSSQSSGVMSHYLTDSQARCPFPVMKTPYIYYFLLFQFGFLLFPTHFHVRNWISLSKTVN